MTRTPDLLLRLSAPMTLSPEAVWLQDEWSAKLERTTHELAKAANEAAKKYEAYLTAMTWVGQLYAACGELMVSANTPPLALAEPIAEAADARVVTGRLMSAVEHWRRSADEQALVAFLASQHDVWRRWREEATRTHQHNNTRRDVMQLVDETRSRLAAAQVGDASRTATKKLETQMRDLDEELAKLHNRVQRDMTNNVKLCSRDLVKYGGRLVDVLSASGYNATCCFQAATAPQASSRAAAPATVAAVSLERPTSSDFTNTPSDFST